MNDRCEETDSKIHIREASEWQIKPNTEGRAIV